MTIFRGIDLQFSMHRNQRIKVYIQAKFQANRGNFLFNGLGRYTLAIIDTISDCKMENLYVSTTNSIVIIIH